MSGDAAERRLLAQLVQWLDSARSTDPRTLFAQDIDWDTGLEVYRGEEFFAALEYTASLRDVVFVDQAVGVGRNAVVFSARDPVTELWHRIAWSMTVVDGRITKVRGARGNIPGPVSPASNSPD